MDNLQRELLVLSKENIREINSRIFLKKLKLVEFTELLFKAKENVKKIQRMYWENKTVRADKNFKQLYLSILNIYATIKRDFKLVEESLKREKLLIKAEQRRISTYNKDRV